MFTMARCVLIAIVCLACSAEDDAPVWSTQVGDDPGNENISPLGDPSLVFREITEWAGLKQESPGYGLAFMDVDRDGFDDVILPVDKATLVMRNRGDGSFYLLYKIEHPQEDANYTYALDVNQDGIDDLLILLTQGALLFQGHENGAFSPMKGVLPAGVDDMFLSLATFGDFNGDGRHDLYLGRMAVNEELDDEGGVFKVDCSNPGNLEDVTAEGPAAVDVFFHSVEQQLVDVTANAGVANPHYTQAAMVIDIDEDGLLDVFVGTEGFQLDAAYYGQPGGGFIDRGVELGMDRVTSAMGYDAVDLNEDGRLDLYITDEAVPSGDKLYMQGADGTFTYATLARGLKKTSEGTGWGLAFLDFDNDADLDLFVANGLPMMDCPGGEQENFYFENAGNADFKYIAPPKWSGLEALRNSRSAVFSDIDHDGDIDVLVSNVGKPPTLLRNETESAGHWLEVRLVHPLLSPAVGSRVTLKIGDRVLRHDMKGTPSFGGSTSHVLHFGLGVADTVSELTVKWPDGSVQVVGEVDADQVITIHKALE
jgi:hypothetical protein